jgi:phosphotransacetylase
MNINDKLVLHKDVEIEVRKDKKKLGTVLVSKGNVEWLPAGNSVNKRRMSWEKFAELMESEGRQVKVK